MFDHSDHFLAERFRNFVSVLKGMKTEIHERFKIHLHYGMIGELIFQGKSLYLFYKKKSAPEGSEYVFKQNRDYQGNAPDKKNDLMYEIPGSLKARQKKAFDLYKIKGNLFEKPSRIVLISYSIPRPDNTSSERRLFEILKILLENGCKIDLVYCSRFYNPSEYTRTFKGDINFQYQPMHLEDYIKIISEKNPDHIWITELWRLNYVEFLTELVREVKKIRPDSRVIIDTVDFHFKEFQRKFELTHNPEDLTCANHFLENEKILYQIADTVFVVSEEEKKDIENAISGVKSFEVIPNIEKVLENRLPYRKRKNICFVGHFGNKHNVDAVIYFIEKIFPLILEKNPKVEFHVLGYASDRYRGDFESPNVKVIGSIKYLEKALIHYKLFVCPMTYGAGMKGKIGGAVAAGIPVVTTSIGAEGFHFTDGEECYIADSPDVFADRCDRCLNDPVVWHHLSIYSMLRVAENCSPGAVSDKLKSILTY